MKKNIALMYAIALLQGMVFYGPVATLYRQRQGLSVFQITLIESISLILCLLLEIPWGIAADKLGYRRTMIFCCGLFFVSKIVFWQAAGFGAFLLERVMLSVVMAGLSGVDTSILYLSCERWQSQRVFGIHGALGTAGLLAASVIFSLFIGDDYRLAGALTAASYGLAALAALFLSEVKAEETSRPGRREFLALARGIFTDKPLLVFLISTAFFTEAHQTLTVFLGQIQYARCGLSPAAIGYCFTAVTLAGFCGVFSAFVTKKAGVKKAGAVFYGAAALACLMPAVGGAAASVGGILGLRITFTLFEPFQAELQNRQIKTSLRATALSINAMIVESIGAGTNLIFGSLAQISLRAAFFFGGALCLAGLGLFLWWHRRAALFAQTSPAWEK